MPTSPCVVPYQLYTGAAASVPLRGRWARPRPVVAVAIVGPAGIYPMDALLDTGSEETIFPVAAARKIGIDLVQAPAGAITGLGTGPLPVRYADVSLRMSDGKESREWPACVAFTPVPIKRPLLGFAGCLQFFTAAFHGDREEVFLEANALYPGS